MVQDTGFTVSYCYARESKKKVFVFLTKSSSNQGLLFYKKLCFLDCLCVKVSLFVQTKYLPGNHDAVFCATTCKATLASALHDVLRRTCYKAQLISQCFEMVEEELGVVGKVSNSSALNFLQLSSPCFPFVTVALQVARNVAPCNSAFTDWLISFSYRLSFHFLPWSNKVIYL